MNFKKLNILSNIYFIFLTLVGLIYLIFILKLFIESAPGFVMLLIYLIDIARHGYSLEKIGSINLLLLTSGISLLTQILLFRLIKAVFIAYNKIKDTTDFAKSIRVSSISRKLITIETNSINAFTSGLLHPRIHISSELKKTNSKDEINAVILHETQHCKAYDPLKGIIISFIFKMIPGFPYKKWIFGYHSVLTELTADAYAEAKLNKRMPIISALYKQGEENSTKIFSAVGFSNSQSERIHILIGKKNIEIKTPLIMTFVIGLSFLTGTLFMKDKQVFYDCAHLNACINSVLTPNKSPLNIHQ